MNGFRNLFPLPHSIFPSHSRRSRHAQTRPRSTSGRAHTSRTPGWRSYSASSGTASWHPVYLLNSRLTLAPDDGPAMTPRCGGLNQTRMQTRRLRGDRGYGGYGEEYLRGSGVEESARSWGGCISRQERERNIQRKIEQVMEMQELLIQEQERLEDEWRCIRKAWDLLEEDRGRERERVRRSRGLNGLDGDGDGAVMGSGRSGRRDTR
ncbi:hypothetical protein DSL72_003252 [Monilinia vaccinii-corymbosi]|uniref:Uncharacterized protein n=1 Tax=Monilinia vaccinii-corymbosi TaxID=61207 RepID=A0A8A3NXG4_9HELO|nr:hypothetical protein DSL72_003252 [Monilinia vaccinii-corymbosi]